MAKWQPKEGEWVVKLSTKQLGIIKECIPMASGTYTLYHCEGFYGILSEIRPATLDDFAVEIKGKKYIAYETVHPYTSSFLKIQVCRQDIDGRWIYYYQFDKGIEYSEVLYEPFFAHYNITVMDEATWKQLSEVK